MDIPALEARHTAIARKKENAYMKARQLARDGKATEAISLLEDTPQGARDLTLHPGMKATLTALVPRKIQIKHSLDDFPEKLDWDGTKTLILHGESGVGKTAYAKALRPNALLISHVDKLRAFDPAVHDCIIFDDMNFSHWPRESQIHLVDNDEERDIHMRYTIASIPAGVARIITTNLNPLSILNCADPAIARRVLIVEMGQNRRFIK